jgi:hypothetical protein
MYVVYHTRVEFCLICFFQLKGDFKQGSKVPGPMNSSTLIDQKL